MSNEADRVYQVDVAATPAAAWAGITDPDVVRKYYYDTAPRTSWELGSLIEFVDAVGDVQITGKVLEYDPPRRMAHTFIATWYGGTDDQGSLHWEIEPAGDGCRITLIHRGAHAETREGSETADGSRYLIESLKTLLEAA